MCGIFGVITKKGTDVVYELVSGLQFLQNRGQEYAGFLTLEDEPSDGFHLLREEGLVIDIVKKSNMKLLKGNSGIAHVRYKTIGKGGTENAQPTYTLSGGIGGCENGHIINTEELQKELETKRIFFKTDNDEEKILKKFAYHFKESNISNLNERAFKCLHDVADAVKGAYSVLFLIKSVGLLAFRDPRAIRPLCYGEKIVDGKKFYAFSSEDIALRNNDYRNIKDIKAGEAILIDNDLNLHKRIIEQKDVKHCVFEWVYFADASSTIDSINVNQVRYNLGKLLAKRYFHLANEIDIVVPVPETAYPASVAFIGYINQNFSQKTELKLGIRKWRFAGRIFMNPEQPMREEMARKNFLFFREVFEGRNVAVIDDSVVRGTNSKFIINKIRSLGAKKIHLFSTFPPFIFPCRYGIDTPTKEELISHDRTVEKVRKIIGADTLNYTTIEDLYEATGTKDLCLACVTGKYPHMENLKKTNI